MQELVKQREQALQKKKEAEQEIEELENQIFKQVKDRVKSQGSTTLEQDGIKLTVTVPMRTTWDEKKLEEIAERIKTAGDDPKQYIKFKPAVSETAYKSWPEQIRKVFEPARTIKPGKRKIEVKDA